MPFNKHAEDLNRYERTLTGMRPGRQGIALRIAEASYRVRKGRKLSDEHLRAIWDTGADIIGPAFYFFVWWALDAAKKRGIERLYFMARAGQTLIKIADILNDRCGYGLDCRYLYGSRQAWLLPAIEDIGEFESEWIMWKKGSFLSVEMVLERLNLAPEDLGQILENKGFTRSSWKADLSPPERKRLISCLRENACVEKIKERSLKERELLFGYLEQEGLFEKVEFGLVDVGWGGSLQFVLSGMLEKRSARSGDGIKGFYFGLTDRKKTYKNDKLTGFLFDWTKKIEFDQMNILELSDIFMSADHGRTVGYKIEDGVYRPVFLEGGVERSLRWGVRMQQESAIKFARAFSEYEGLCLPEKRHIKRILSRLISKFSQRPSFREAEAYGSYLRESDVLGRELRELSPKVSRAEFWLDVFNIKKMKNYWVEGSFRRTNKLILFAILGASRVKNRVIKRLEFILRKIFGGKSR